MVASDPGRTPPAPVSESLETATRRHVNVSAWNFLLLLPLLGTLIPPLYNKKAPELFGLPFFYWYQMLWILISVACTVIVYRATRGER